MKGEALKISQSDGGVAVRIYAVDGGGSFPIHGAYDRGAGWQNACWTRDGYYSFQRVGSVAVRCDLDITGEAYVAGEQREIVDIH